MTPGSRLDNFLFSLMSRIDDATTREEIRDIFTTLERYEGSLEPPRAWRRPIMLGSIAVVGLGVLGLAGVIGLRWPVVVLGALALIYTPFALILAKIKRLRPRPGMIAGQLYQQAVALEAGRPITMNAPILRHLLTGVVAHRVADTDYESVGLQGGTPGSRSDPEFVVFDFTTPDGSTDEMSRDPTLFAFCDAIALPTRLREPLKRTYPVAADDACDTTPVESLAPGAAAAIERLGDALEWVEIETDGAGLIVFTHEVSAIWPPHDIDLPLSDPVALRRAIDRSEAVAALKARVKALLRVVEALEGGSTGARPTLAEAVSGAAPKDNSIAH
ncbi:hypothetical protein [Salinicola avicenniae]|uniref:hypothetical protein n=1 Tax=Salinicola avicenniae TaxID=2916836 RepID=UPI002073FB42|nr:MULTISPECIES: hypothetical protein [unclassified Salinicola]